MDAPNPPRGNNNRMNIDSEGFTVVTRKQSRKERSKDSVSLPTPSTSTSKGPKAQKPISPRRGNTPAPPLLSEWFPNLNETRSGDPPLLTSAQVMQCLITPCNSDVEGGESMTWSPG
ncbi:hypothetical protein KC19_VG109700 [Ceratodon purpureus]|uniref:Uncharacterized protein n=1 Tax=Ceratodon purpureus TaxID=3225 RepID=A0A8T0HPC2_CERPU|nr:hypothetical protein KC19_VG109700 [Ceratodon purpureus]